MIYAKFLPYAQLSSAYQIDSSQISAISDLLRNHVVHTRAGRRNPSCSVDRYVSRSIPLSFGSGRKNEGRDSPEDQGDFPVGTLQLPFHAETPFFATGGENQPAKGSPPLRFGLPALLSIETFEWKWLHIDPSVLYHICHRATSDNLTIF